MSTKISSACWDLQGITPTQKLVLISLADQANDDGVCWPSVGSIARRTCVSERAVQAAIKALCCIGLLVRDDRTGRSTVYTVTPAEYAPQHEAHPRSSCTPPPQMLHPTPADAAPPPPQLLHPTPADAAPRTIKEPSLEPSKEPSNETEAAKMVLEYLNDKTGKRFKPTDPNLRLIRGRLAEGHNPDELMAVVDRKIAEWAGTKYEQYLRPATLFGAEKCNQYVGELSRPSEEQESDRKFREWLGEGISGERIIDGEVLR